MNARPADRSQLWARQQVDPASQPASQTPCRLPLLKHQRPAAPRAHHLHLDAGLNADAGDLLDHLGGGVQVDQALVDAHLEAAGEQGGRGSGAGLGRARAECLAQVRPTARSVADA